MARPIPHDYRRISTWQEGANTRRAGKTLAQNPYAKSTVRLDWCPDYLGWVNGWNAANANMAAESIRRVNADIVSITSNPAEIEAAFAGEGPEVE